MKRLLIALLLLFPLLSFSQIQMGLDIDGEDVGDASGRSVSLSTDGLTLAIGAYYNGGNGIRAGHVRVYNWTGSSWLQKGLDIDGEAAGDHSGFSVSLSADGNILAIGALYNDGIDTGHVRVFNWTGSSWLQKGLGIDVEAASFLDGSFISLSADGNTLAIGAGLNDGNGLNSGHVRVYHWTGSSWLQKGLDIDGEAAGDHSGTSVSLSADGNTLAIGARGNHGNGNESGHVRIYNWTGSTWLQKGLDIDGETANSSGGSVSLSADGNTLAIGATHGYGNGLQSGHVRIYNWTGSTWLQKGLDIDGEAAGDQSGNSVSLSADGNTLAVDAPYNDGNGIDAGHARVYNWTGSTWLQKGLDIDGEAAGDLSGRFISLSADGNTLAIGAGGNNGNGTSAGHVRVYKLKGIYGQVFNDFISSNCLLDPSELGILGFSGIINPGGIVVTSNSGGYWLVDSLPIGNYTLTLDNSTQWSMPCGNSISFSVTNPDSFMGVQSIGLVSNFPCPEPNISVTMPFIRPCFSNQLVYVSACNDAMGTGILETPWAEIELPDYLTLDSASLPYTAMGNNTFSFQLTDTLFPGQCIDFTLNTTLSCSTQLGQTFCMEASLFPADSCVFDTVPAPPGVGVSPCLLPWDKSSLKVDGWCDNDTVYFTIENTGDPGDGDMVCYAPVRVYVDGQYILLDSILLLGGEIDTFSFAGGGLTWHLEADQHPLHPGNSHPNATIELCGDPTNWTPGLVNIFPQDDADPVLDIYCGEARGSYDPNDKTGYPLGVTENHYIHPNGKIDYVIRFQNTGTDTAFTVMIRDTLDEDLDIFSVVSGVSSHDYHFEMYGPRILQWTFSNIMLPDSFVNEAASNGFITFSVFQNSDLPNGSEINNSAAIYFDFNEPVITNMSSHIIDDGSGLCTPSPSTLRIDTCDSFTWVDGVTYSASNNTAIFPMMGMDSCYSMTTLDLTIESLNASLTQVGDTLIADLAGATYQWLDCNNSNSPIAGETSQSFSTTSPGNYAVEVSTVNCNAISDCYFITGVGVQTVFAPGAINVYPNPSRGQADVSFPKVVENLKINLLDLNGRIIEQFQYAGAKEEVSLQMTDVPNGVYFLQMTFEGGGHQVKLIVIR